MSGRVSGLLSLAVALSVSSAVPSTAHARDWFVRAGSSGDGSQQSPFGDPWEALEKCEAGDRVHVAEGKYYGRQESGWWKIPYPRVELLGGYDRDFKQRDPWKRHSELLWKKGSKNRPGSNQRVSGSNDDHSGVVVDGFLIDLADQNKYSDESLKEPFQPTAVELQHPGAVIRNNIILNASWDAVRVRQGVTVENNLILNTLNWGISVVSGNTLSGNTSTAPAVIRNNTVAFSWDKDKPGAGGYGGSGLAIHAPSIIEGNLIVNSDNHGIYTAQVKLDRITLRNNTFFMNLHSNLRFHEQGGSPVSVDDQEMELLEEAGLRAHDGNLVENPGLSYDKAWMDKFSQRTSSMPGKVVMDDWNKLRQTMGLPLIGSGGAAATGLAPPWDPQKALALLKPSRSKHGARAKPLEVGAFSTATAAAPVRDYRKASILDWAKKADTVDGQALEMVVGMGGVTNTGALPENERAGYLATWLYDPAGSGERVFGFYRKGTADQRIVDDLKSYDGRGKAPQVFVVRGVARSFPKNFPKAGFVIDVISEVDASGPGSADRPKGRDWFVRADAKGGDGSKAKPFRDPYLALEKAEAGDTIHVAAGEYYGKLRTGRWTIDTPYISLLGGYDASFTKRDPWANHTHMHWPAGSKSSRFGFIIQGAEDHTGAVVDGFIFDRREMNQYKPGGDLDYDNSDKTESVRLFSSGSTVRNCVFVNGAEGALWVTSANVVENNIFMNHVFRNIRVSRHNDDRPAIIRNNTILFAWDPIRFGKGNTMTGTGITIEGGVKAVIDQNLIGFIDNHAVLVSAEPRDVEVTNNVFFNNLFSNYFKSNTVIDDTTMAQFREAGLKKADGNVAKNPNLPIDPTWIEVYMNRTAHVPGKVSMDDWNNLRELMGMPVLATGGKAASGFAPFYDWKKAVALFPKDAQVKAGARRVPLPVKFEGIVREQPTYSYEDADWATLSKNAASLEGKRVQLKVILGEWDTGAPQLPGMPKEEWAAAKLHGLQGIDSGLPKRGYVKKGTRHERAIRAAPGLRTRDIQIHWVRGLVGKNGDLVIDEVERADLD